MGVVGGQTSVRRLAIGTESDVSFRRSGRGLEATTGLQYTQEVT